MLRAAVLTLLAGLGFIAYWYSQQSDAGYELVADAEVIQTELPDQTAVVLEKGARITAMEIENERAYSLKGEAYFEIHPDTKPFVLYTDALRIRDIGTAFRVKAPENNDTIWVEVKEGIVQLEKEGNTNLEIKAGESAYYLKSVGSFTKKEAMTKEQTRASFQFIESKMADVVAQLEQQFGVHVELENAALANCEISVEFEQEQLIPILEIISITLNLDYEETDKGYRILGTACTVD
ncbi:MAG: FecR family protein [Bacteroidetes bacterium]|nr:MAG: FecR family protein [Bacteroidota bacterium]